MLMSLLFLWLTVVVVVVVAVAVVNVVRNVELLDKWALFATALTSLC